MAVSGALFGFLVSLGISSLIIYLATKLLGEEEGFGTAILAALSGAIIFALTFYFIGTGWVASLVGGIGWLIAMGSLYNIGWLKAFFIAVVIWVLTAVVSILLPAARPL
ncbi:MAG: hypothetical protein AABX00_05155 [Nanoarchaeota archaeon]